MPRTTRPAMRLTRHRGEDLGAAPCAERCLAKLCPYNFAFCDRRSEDLVVHPRLSGGSPTQISSRSHSFLPAHRPATLQLHFCHADADISGRPGSLSRLADVDGTSGLTQVPTKTATSRFRWTFPLHSTLPGTSQSKYWKVT